MKWSDLSEYQKSRVRDINLSYDWWDSVYEDASRMGEILGIEIFSQDKRKTPDISFSGFWSQGDGCSFKGRFKPSLDAAKKMRSETSDTELNRLAELSTMMAATQRLLRGEIIAAQTSSSHRCYTQRIEFYYNDDVDEDFEKDYQSFCQDFADWIYARLEAEYEYLTSDERFEDEEFDEYGVMI